MARTKQSARHCPNGNKRTNSTLRPNTWMPQYNGYFFDDHVQEQMRRRDELDEIERQQHQEEEEEEQDWNTGSSNSSSSSSNHLIAPPTTPKPVLRKAAGFKKPCLSTGGLICTRLKVSRRRRRPSKSRTIASRHKKMRRRLVFEINEATTPERNVPMSPNVGAGTPVHYPLERPDSPELVVQLCYKYPPSTTRSGTVYQDHYTPY